MTSRFPASKPSVEQLSAFRPLDVLETGEDVSALRTGNDDAGPVENQSVFRP